MEFFPDPIIEYDIENVYYPSDDTYLIVDYFKSHIDQGSFDGIPLENIKNILDMGTGTGFIALTLEIFKKKNPHFHPQIYASDILIEAINLAKRNEKLNDLNGTIKFYHSNLFKSFPNDLKYLFDIVIFNPPYLSSSKIIRYNKKIDFSWDGGKSGFETITKFLKEVKSFLNLKAHPVIYIVSSSTTDLRLLNEIIEEFGFKNKILEKKHIFMEDIFLNCLELN